MRRVQFWLLRGILSPRDAFQASWMPSLSHKFAAVVVAVVVGGAACYENKAKATQHCTLGNLNVFRIKLIADEPNKICWC